MVLIFTTPVFVSFVVFPFTIAAFFIVPSVDFTLTVNSTFSTIDEICRKYGFCKSSFYRALKQENLELPKKRFFTTCDKDKMELAEKMWSEHQVIVATHFNTGTYHNHFVVNSVNMFTGKKFNCNISNSTFSI